MLKKFIGLVVVTSAITGCSSIPYDCPLKGEGKAKCASMQDSYKASLKQSSSDRAANPESVFDSKALNSEYSEVYQAEGYPQPAQHGLPVYNPGKAYRAWVGPWTDADGILHGGEYVYFATPGSWNYGSLKQAGEASGSFGPVKPDAVGFDPVSKAQAKEQQAKQNQPISGGDALPAEKQNKKQAPSLKAGEVTQPYETITE